jgi:hypothetical protein
MRVALFKQTYKDAAAPQMVVVDAAVNFFNKVMEVAEAEGHHPDLHLTSFRNVEVGRTEGMKSAAPEDDSSSNAMLLPRSLQRVHHPLGRSFSVLLAKSPPSFSAFL